MKTLLIRSSLAVSSRKSYCRFWSRLIDFITGIQGLAFVLPVSPVDIAHFIAYLHINQFSPSTISSHLSAIAYYHESKGFSDPTDHVTIRRMIKGCKRLRPQKDSRLPLLLSHIQKLVTTCQFIFGDNYYLKVMYQALITFTFHGFFRLGEILPKRLSTCTSVIQFSHITVRNKSLLVQLHHFKTKTSNKPTTVVIRNSAKSCPVLSMQTYLVVRGTQTGCLFITSTGQPVTFSQFRNVLRRLLDFCNLSTLHYTPHSFRIGACTQAILAGVPEHKIQHMGRWRSQAFRRYIRVPNLTSS